MTCLCAVCDASSTGVQATEAQCIAVNIGALMLVQVVSLCAARGPIVGGKGRYLQWP